MRQCFSAIVFLMAVVVGPQCSADDVSSAHDFSVLANPESPMRESNERAWRPQMLPIPAGSFRMGSNDDAKQQPIHVVSVPAFLMAKTEVTQAQWRAVMGSNPSHFSGCDDCPVEDVSFDDVQRYIQTLNKKSGKQYRLPSEAEWEYACRAGGNHTYCGSNNINAVVWYDKNSGTKTHPVGRKKANAFGLHDMSGNVWEWVQDCWKDSYVDALVDGNAWTSGDCGLRVLRGGSFGDFRHNTRAAVRTDLASGDRSLLIGFRVALTPGKTGSII